MHKYSVLNAQELNTALSSMKDWKIVDNVLNANFIFPDFRTSIAFLNMIAIESEVLNHHPEWIHNYKKVEIRLCTHDAGNKITDLDIKLATYISKAAHRSI